VLRAKAEYFVKVRAYTKLGIAIETDWATIDGVVDRSDKKGLCIVFLSIFVKS
jgi:hypothetical protein